MRKTITDILFLCVLGVIIFIYRDTLYSLFERVKTFYLPCSSPITYSIAQFDPEFGISKTEFLSDMQQAESIWEKAAGKQLFAYSADNGVMKVNLIFDSRQQTTVELGKIDTTLKSDQATFNATKAKYNSLNADYLQKKATYQADGAAFDAKKTAYEAEVQKWNAQGGAPQNVYIQLQSEKSALDAQILSLQAEEATLNAEASQINILANSLNQLATSLNIKVNQFNTVGATNGSEFEEGDFESDAKGERINIYQYDNQDKLIRLLAHELGHALGLEHNDDPKAIMYKLNEGLNEKLTAADTAELDTLCKIKNN